MCCIALAVAYTHFVMLHARKIARKCYGAQSMLSDRASAFTWLRARTRAGLGDPTVRPPAAGYEEAAAQGLVAGINAARVAAGAAPVSFPRESSYLGTLIDDLVTKVPRAATRLCCSTTLLWPLLPPTCRIPASVGLACLHACAGGRRRQQVTVQSHVHHSDLLAGRRREDAQQQH